MKTKQLELPLSGSPPPPVVLTPCATYVAAGARPGLPEHYLAWYQTEDERVGQITVPAPLAQALAEAHERVTRPLPARLRDLPEFRLLGPSIRRELYDRDGGHADPRRRFELELPSGSWLVDVALGLRCACAACGASIHPFRRRKQKPASGHSRRQKAADRLYVAVACPLDVRVGCSRGDAAAEAYVDLEEALVAGGWL